MRGNVCATFLSPGPSIVAVCGPRSNGGTVTGAAVRTVSAVKQRARSATRPPQRYFITLRYLFAGCHLFRLYGQRWLLWGVGLFVTGKPPSIIQLNMAKSQTESFTND